MSAYKIVQKLPFLEISSTSGITTSNPIPLKSGYFRILVEDDAYLEIDYNPNVSTSSFFVPAKNEIVLKERVLSQPIIGVTTGTSTILEIPSGTHCAFNVGDYIQLTGFSPSGVNTNFTQITSVSNAASYDSDYGTRMTVDLNTSSVGVVTNLNGEARKVVRVAALNAGIGTNRIHITEVQVVSNFS